MRRLILRRSSAVLSLTALILFLFTATCLAMPDTLKITKVDGKVVQYGLNEAIMNTDMLAAMNTDLGSAFERGLTMIGILTNGKIVDMNSALGSAGGYSSYENMVKDGAIPSTSDLTANIDWQGTLLDNQGDIDFRVVAIY